MRTLLVVGSAPCLSADVERALLVRPFAAVMLVNGACTALEDADHVLSGHTDMAEHFAGARRKKFPNAAPWRLHATVKDKHRAEAESLYPSVTDWWSAAYNSGGTSSAKAALLGLNCLGFDEVILCGAPLDGSGYTQAEAPVPLRAMCHRVGDPEKQDHKTILRYRAKFNELATGPFKDRVFSMSGFTRACLGEPT